MDRHYHRHMTESDELKLRAQAESQMLGSLMQHAFNLAVNQAVVQAGELALLRLAMKRKRKPKLKPE